MIGINNWPTLIETLKQLYKKHTKKNTIIKNGNPPTIRKLVRNDLVICV
jgi:FMN phosphatase YigB (HAD superfamily)